MTSRVRGAVAVNGVCLGSAFGALLASVLDQDLRAAINLAILGAIIGSMCESALRLRRATGTAGRVLAAQVGTGPRDLWDPWLDVEGAEPSVSVGPRSRDVDEQPRDLVPQRAPVRPRFVSPEGDGSLPLEDEILAFAKRAKRGAIMIVGPMGSGKTTALEHLAAVLPPSLGVSFLDDPEPSILAAAAANGLVVYAAERSAHPEHLAIFRLAPWCEDERIEYLLAAARPQCASVMTRLKDSDDCRRLDGSPELWRLVLDRMAADPSVRQVQHAVKVELAAVLKDRNMKSAVEDRCLARLTRADTAGPIAGDRQQEVRGNPALERLLRHRPIQLLIVASRINAELAWGSPCASLTVHLPRDLVQEAGAS